MASRALYEGRIKDYVWLEISGAVAQWTATLFSSDNAVAKRAIINNDPNTALKSSSIQAEVLVLTILDARWITFPDASTAGSAVKVQTNIDVPDFDLPF